METGQDLAICVTCGTQYGQPLTSHPESCQICDDPRQYVPPEGQSWTSLRELRSKPYKNEWHQDPVHSQISWFTTNPKAGIGQRSFLLQTPHGNVLWDLVTFLDEETINYINEKGGLKAIIISHPHFYTTHIEWSKALNRPVYISAEDEEWVNRADESSQRRRLICGKTVEILPGVTAVKCGGHFPGSLILHWDNKIFIADTMLIVPSGLYHIDRPIGTPSFTFMWSYPNQLPLSPDAIIGIWKALRPFKFDTVFGGFPNQVIRSKNVKSRVLESMKIFIKSAGHSNHVLLEESL